MWRSASCGVVLVASRHRPLRARSPDPSLHVALTHCCIWMDVFCTGIFHIVPSIFPTRVEHLHCFCMLQSLCQHTAGDTGELVSQLQLQGGCAHRCTRSSLPGHPCMLTCWSCLLAVQTVLTTYHVVFTNIERCYRVILLPASDSLPIPSALSWQFPPPPFHRPPSSPLAFHPLALKSLWPMLLHNSAEAGVFMHPIAPLHHAWFVAFGAGSAVPPPPPLLHSLPDCCIVCICISVGSAMHLLVE